MCPNCVFQLSKLDKKKKTLAMKPKHCVIEIITLNNQYGIIKYLKVKILSEFRLCVLFCVMYELKFILMY